MLVFLRGTEGQLPLCAITHWCVKLPARDLSFCEHGVCHSGSVLNLCFRICAETQNLLQLIFLLVEFQITQSKHRGMRLIME